MTPTEETCNELDEHGVALQQERKTGKWNCSDDRYETAICSCCKWDTGEPWEATIRWFKFCPNCGAMMVGDAE